MKSGMMNYWIEATLGLERYRSAIDEETVVILLQGTNAFGEEIHSYLQVTIDALVDLNNLLQSKAGFNPDDYGDVVAAGRGAPSADERLRMSALYGMMHTAPPAKGG